MTIEDLATLANDMTQTLGREQTTKELRISAEDLFRLERGDPEVLESDRTLVQRLPAWAKTNGHRLFESVGQPAPPFDHLHGFWTNFYRGPRNGHIPAFLEPIRRSRLLDFELNFPFGVPACALTPHSSYVRYFAQRGFDLITYKTVRDRPWNPHPFPQWASTVDVIHQVSPEHFDEPVVATLNPRPRYGAEASLANSFGVPSLDPQDWQQDIADSKAMLSSGQVLAVSVMGSPEIATDDNELVRQFTLTADLALQAGADIIEVNLSCPNTGGDLLCLSPEASAQVVQAVAQRLKPSGTPLFIKISYLDPPILKELVEKCSKYIDGVVAINTVSVPVVNRNGTPFFGERWRAGLSGAAIRTLGLDTSRELVDLRDRMRRHSDLVIIGVGGVMIPSDFDAYLDVGVDVVQSCSGAWLNPDLAIQIQLRGRQDLPAEASIGSRSTAWGTVLTADEAAMLRALQKNESKASMMDLTVAARLTPSRARAAQQSLLRQGLVKSRGDFLTITPHGVRMLQALRSHPPLVAQSSRAEGTAVDIDEQLESEIQRLEA
jgi:dihydroorotate dehydrogenase